MTQYTVWVGGVEVNDYALSLEDATKWAEDYRNNGYDDVAIAQVADNWVDRKYKQWEN